MNTLAARSGPKSIFLNTLRKTSRGGVPTEAERRTIMQHRSPSAQPARLTTFRLATVSSPVRLLLLSPLSLSFCCALALLAGCRRNYFPDVPAGYHEFAYVSNGAAN